MAERIAYVEAVFGADITAFRRGASQVRRELGILSDTADGMSRIGRNMTLMLTAPLLAFGGAAVKAAGDFEASMRNVNSILFAQEDELQALSDATLAFGSSLRSGPVAAADALYTVVSAGFTDLATAMEVSQVAARTAEAGLADLTTTAEALSAAMLAYGAGADEAQYFSDVLTRTVQVGVGEMQEFATGIGNVTASAVMLGVGFDELGATQAFLTQRGLSAAKAATMLNRAFEKLISPTDEMQTVFDQLGVSTGRELISNFGGLEGALAQIYNIVGDDSAALRDLFNTTQAFKAVGPILNDFDAYTRAMDEFGDAVGGATDRALMEQYASLPAMLERMASAGSGAAITIGDKLIPVIKPLVGSLTDLFLAVQTIPDEFIVLGAAIATAVAAAGPLLWILGSLLTPAGLVAGAIAGIGVAVATNIGGARETFIGFFNDVTGGLDGLVSAFDNFWQNLHRTGSNVPNPFDQLQTATATGRAFNLETTVWDIWTAEGADTGYETWEAFREAFQTAAGDTPLNMLGAGAYTLDGGGTYVPPLVIDDFAASVEEYKNSMPTFGERLERAIEESWPGVERALNNIRGHVGRWFRNDLLPSFDDFGSQMMQALTGIFTVEPNISGPLDQAEDWMTSGTDAKSLVENLKTFIGETLLGGVEGGFNWLGTNLPALTASVQSFFSTLGDWIIDTGLPTLSYSLGYLGGMISSLLVQAITGADAGAAADTFGEAVWTPLTEGFGDAKADMGLADSIAPEIVTAIMLAVPLVGPLLSARGFGGGIASAMWGVLGSGAKGAWSVGGSVVSQIGSTFAVQLVSSGFASGFRTSLTAAFARFGIGAAVSGGLTASVTGALSNIAWGALGVAETVATGLGSVLGAALPIIGIGAVAISVGKWAFENRIGWDFAEALTNAIFGPDAYAHLQERAEAFLGPAMQNMAANWYRLIGRADLANALTAADPYGAANKDPKLSMGVPIEDQLAPIAGQVGGSENFWTSMYTVPPDVADGLLPVQSAISEISDNIETSGSALNAVLLPALQAAGTNIPAYMSPANQAMSNMAISTTTAATQTEAMVSALQEVNGRTFTANFVLNLGVNGNLNMPGRAKGGTMLSGNSYLVGEQGPEILTMGSASGFMTSNGAISGALANGGGGSYSSNNVNIYGVQDVDNLLYELERRGIYL